MEELNEQSLNRPDWTYTIERTIYTDDIFGVIGRLLYMATKFESNCNAFIGLTNAKSNPHILHDDKAFERFIKQINKSTLGNNIIDINKKLGVQSIESVLTKAKDIRNQIAHELTLGLEHKFGNIDRENEIEDTLKGLASDIVIGEYITTLLLCNLNKEEYPKYYSIKKNIGWVLNINEN
jgi:hypothetical protein